MTCDSISIKHFLLIKWSVMSNVIGYLREYNDESDTQLQLQQLQAAGATSIYQEKPHSIEPHSTQLYKFISNLQPGDTIVVTSFDRIARNTKHLLEILVSLNSAGATFKELNSGIDTSISHGHEIREMLKAIVEFERQVVRERQSAGIAKAKQAGRYKGRKPTAMQKADRVLELNAEGLTRQKIAAELDIGVASVYRILKAYAEPKKTIVRNANKSVKVSAKRSKVEKRKTTIEAESRQLSLF